MENNKIVKFAPVPWENAAGELLHLKDKMQFVKIHKLNFLKGPLNRPPSPRVKPAAHFARVVANILCDAPCDHPLKQPSVYADDEASVLFKNPLHNDFGFQKYVDTTYGDKYVKKDVFLKELPAVLKSRTIKGTKSLERIPVQNKKCLLPIYNKAYYKRAMEENCCDDIVEYYVDKNGHRRHKPGRQGWESYSNSSIESGGRGPRRKRGDRQKQRWQDEYMGTESRSRRGRNRGSRKEMRDGFLGRELRIRENRDRIRGNRSRRDWEYDDFSEDDSRSRGGKSRYRMGRGGGRDRWASDRMNDKDDRSYGGSRHHQNRWDERDRNFPGGGGGGLGGRNQSQRVWHQQPQVKHWGETTSYKFDITKAGKRKDGRPIDGRPMGDPLRNLGVGGDNNRKSRASIKQPNDGRRFSRKTNTDRDRGYAFDTDDDEDNYNNSKLPAIDRKGNQNLFSTNRPQGMQGNGHPNATVRKRNTLNGTEELEELFTNEMGRSGEQRLGEYNSNKLPPIDRKKGSGYINRDINQDNNLHPTGSNPSEPLWDEEEDDYLDKTTGLPSGGLRETAYTNKMTKMKGNQARNNKYSIGYVHNKRAKSLGVPIEPPRYKRRVPYKREVGVGVANRLRNLGLENLGQGDQLNVNPVVANPCWDLASKLFKTPLRAPAIPLPEKLILHIEKRFPQSQWPRGTPIALRYYPSGKPFCVVFPNGAGRVHYPHGGLALAISAPGPSYSQVLVVRDPFDQFYFFDKAVMADLNCNGNGTVWDENGNIKVQYNIQGGYKQEGPGKVSQRWQWNAGGQRMILKLNRYMALRIMDYNKIHLVFYGNKRGFRLNVGAGRRVNLMSVTCENIEPVANSYRGRPTVNCGDFDPVLGRFIAPGLRMVNERRQYDADDQCLTDNDYSAPQSEYQYSFVSSRCNTKDQEYK